MPPLRARPEDIGLLTRHFLTLASREGLPAKQIDEEAVGLLTAMPWRGNVRELKNFIYRLVLTTREDRISESTIAQLPGSGEATEMPANGCTFDAAVAQFMAEQRQKGIGRDRIYARALAAFEKPLLQTIMAQARGNQLQAAAMLGINRNTLQQEAVRLWPWRQQARRVAPLERQTESHQRLCAFPATLSVARVAKWQQSAPSQPLSKTVTRFGAGVRAALNGSVIPT